MYGNPLPLNDLKCKVKKQNFRNVNLISIGMVVIKILLIKKHIVPLSSRKEEKGSVFMRHAGTLKANKIRKKYVEEIRMRCPRSFNTNWLNYLSEN